MLKHLLASKADTAIQERIEREIEKGTWSGEEMQLYIISRIAQALEGLLEEYEVRV